MIFIILALLLLPSAAQAQVTRFVKPMNSSPAPAGTTCSIVDRCSMKSALSIANAGDTISMQSSTPPSQTVYDHNDDRIWPPAGRGGTSSAPILIKAETDGGVNIDGRFLDPAVQILKGNNWWTIEGIDAHNGRITTVNVRGDNNTLRRIVAYDSKFWAASSVYSFQSEGINNLCEDCAGFGIASHIITASQNWQGPTVVRRFWGRFEGSANGNNASTAAHLLYNNRQPRCENCILEFWGRGGPATSYRVFTPTTTSATLCPEATPGTPATQTCTHGSGPIPAGAASLNRIDKFCPPNWDGGLWGSLLYGRSDSNLTGMTGSGQAFGTFGTTGRAGGAITLKDIFIYMDPSVSGWSTARALWLDARRSYSATNVTCTSPPQPGSVNAITNVTTIANVADQIDTSDPPNTPEVLEGSWWNITNLVHATSIATLPGSANPYTGTTGAQLCKRYTSDFVTNTPTLTTEKLFPWPMRQRIIDATTRAGVYGAGYSAATIGCDSTQGNCVGAFPSRRTVDVHADVEAILGTIPAACTGDTGAPTFPAAPGFNPTTVTLTFGGTDYATYFFTTAGVGFTEAGGVILSATNSSARLNTGYQTNMRGALFLGGTISSSGAALRARYTDPSNNVKVTVTPVAGTNNDTLKVEEINAGTVIPLVSPINLGVDLSDGDGIGIDATSVYFRDTAWGEWRKIADYTTSLAPASSYVALTGQGTSFTEFRADGTGTADTVQPTVPANCSVTNTSDTTQTFTCDPSTDNVVANPIYHNYRCSGAACSPTVEVDVGTGTSFISSALSTSTLYRYCRKADDGTNPLTACSTVVEATTPTGVDTTPPVTATPPFIHRRQGATPYLNDATVTLPAPSDNVGVNTRVVERGEANCTNFVELDTLTGSTLEYLDDDAAIPITAGRCYRFRDTDLAGNVSNSPTIVLPAVRGGRNR